MSEVVGVSGAASERALIDSVVCAIETSSTLITGTGVGNAIDV